MARYGVETRLGPEQVILEAVAYFGDGGLGLAMTERSACCAQFEGGGGHIEVTAVAGEKNTEVELVTREFDYDVKRFMRKLN